MNSEGPRDESPTDVPRDAAGDGVGDPPPAQSEPEPGQLDSDQTQQLKVPPQAPRHQREEAPIQSRPPREGPSHVRQPRDDRNQAAAALDQGGRRTPPGAQRARVPGDDRQTAIIPTVADGPSDLRDPIDAVKAALDGKPPPGRNRRSASSNKPRSLRDVNINWKWVRRSLAAAAVVLILLPLVTFGMAYFIVEVPKPGDIRTAQVSTILASDGSEIAKIVPPEGNRVDVTIDQIPESLRNAVMAAEDRDFYSNPGFSFTAFLRAFKNNLFGDGDLQGGSTITQQYVKNALVGSERDGLGGILRKAKELVISTKMSSEWSKDEVMQAYLNIIYFGRGAYGVGAAAQAYFGKPVEQLNVAEGALLAALIQRPSTLDPAVDPEGAVERWSWVLDGMVTIGALSETDRAAQVFPPTIPQDAAQTQTQTTGPNGLIQRQVTRELLELFDISEQTLNTEGLTITTTIDPKAQQAAEAAAAEYMDGQNPDMRTAIVSVEPGTGAIKAYYGGTDAQGFDFAQAGLQTGSSFKVFALLAALRQGIGLGHTVDSSPVEMNGVSIGNVEGNSCGQCNIAEALKRSLNTSYYRLMLELKNGPADVAEAAHDAGVAESFPGVSHTLSEDGEGGPPNNGIVLGQYQTRVLDMASAYATIADQGTYHAPHFVQKVVNAQGQVLFDAGAQDDPGEKRFDDAVANNAIAAMRPIAGYSNHALSDGRDSAAKTGTVQLGDTGDNRDAWMVGFTPQLSTAVWVGTTDGVQPLENEWGSAVYGSGLPSDIWQSTMDGALDGTEEETFPEAEEIGGYAGVPQAPPPPTSTTPPPPSETVIQPTIEVAPGITIPVGPPTTIPVSPTPLPTPGAPVDPAQQPIDPAQQPSASATQPVPAPPP